MRNEPNLRQSQIFITLTSKMSYNEKCELDTWSKRTQTNPILPASAGKIAPLFRMSFILRGPVFRSFSEGGFYIVQNVTGLKLNSRYNKAVR